MVGCLGSLPGRKVYVPVAVRHDFLNACTETVPERRLSFERSLRRRDSGHDRSSTSSSLDIGRRNAPSSDDFGGGP